MSGREKTIVHVINGLGLGGAETMLYNVIRYGSANSEYRNIVVSLGEGDHFVEPLRDLDVEVVELSLRKFPISTIREFINNTKLADIVCSWSYHTNMLSMVTKLRTKFRLVWIINHEDTSRKTNKLPTWLIMQAGARVSPYLDSIAYNGTASQKSHVELGYSTKEEYVVPNGCDVNIYSPASKSEDLLIEILGEDASGVSTILSAGRWHPIKDHATLIEAFSTVVELTDKRVAAILCGPGIDPQNRELVELLKKNDLELGRDVFLIGSRSDLPSLMATCSVFVLHSRAEAFPNVLVQAMSAGSKIVSTDVGIVSDLTNGAINPVPPGDPAALSDEILKQLSAQKTQMDVEGRTLRQIVIDDYSITEVVRKYEQAIIG